MQFGSVVAIKLWVPTGFHLSLLNANGHVSNVKELFRTSTMPNRCNASFITLIPKVQNLLFMKDFMLLSLIYSTRSSSKF